MQEKSRIWQEIFFIHQYFLDSNFTFSFIDNYYSDLRSRYGNIGQTARLQDIYFTITGKNLPEKIELSNENYKSIEFLVIDNLDLDNISLLEKFQNIKQLKASHNKIDSITPLKKFANFSSLDLSGNLVSNIEPLSKFLNLRYLDLCTNLVFDAKPLTELENLWTLDIQSNKIDYLNDFSKLQVLQELYIGNNKIKSLHGLVKLKELKKLNLGLNPLPNEELVSIKKSLPNCEITFEFYPPDDEGLGKYVKLEIFEEIVFLLDHSNYDKTSQYCIYYLEADNNKKPLKLNSIMKEAIDKKEINNSQFFQREPKRKHFLVDTDTEVSCQIEY
ncbi:MAG: hypothetical protein IPQ08_08985 [Chitinophagaceae bacterium]|nr:hypothetical protein [Chitinophagaceae bacterium]